jgi:LmbE family N-acetylglucosaminyl deacetylase
MATGLSDPLEYAAVRRREAENALAIVGLSPDDIIALGIDDQECSFRFTETALLLGHLFARIRPEIVVTHAYEGGHPDHDATCFAVHAACRRARKDDAFVPAIVEMSSYFGRDGVRITSSFIDDTIAARTVSLDETRSDHKKRMLACHHSQSELIALFPLRVESFRPAPRYDFSKAPHPGKLFYEYHSLGIDGARWRILAVKSMRDLDLP